MPPVCMIKTGIKYPYKGVVVAQAYTGHSAKATFRHNTHLHTHIYAHTDTHTCTTPDTYTFEKDLSLHT